MNNVKKKHDNNNWVRDVLKDTDPYEVRIRKRWETRRKRLLEKAKDILTKVTDKDTKEFTNLTKSSEIKIQKDMDTIRIALNLPLVKEVKPKAKRGYIKRFF